MPIPPGAAQVSRAIHPEPGLANTRTWAGRLVVVVLDSRTYTAVVAAGRGDFPNQINNVLAFPGIFRGALDAGARRIRGRHPPLPLPWRWKPGSGNQ